MFVEALRVLGLQVLAEQAGVLVDRVQNAAFAVDPALVFRAEQAVEQAMRNFLWRERAVEASPTHVLVNGTAERFLRDADLQRPETSLRREFARDHLVHRRSARTAAGVMRAGH